MKTIIAAALAALVCVSSVAAHVAPAKGSLEHRLEVRVAHDRGVIRSVDHQAVRVGSAMFIEYRLWLERESHAADLQRALAALERLQSPASIICRVFGPYCSQAIAVSTCESHLYPGAQNGQYLGLFQMGDYARGRYGHGPDALTQARAAYRYFIESGADWSPWECKP